MLHYELHSHHRDNSRDYLSWLCLQTGACFCLAKSCFWLFRDLTWCQLGGPHSGGLHLPTWGLCQPSQKILVHTIPSLPFQRRDLLSSQPGIVLLRDFQLKISLGLLYPGRKGKEAKAARRPELISTTALQLSLSQAPLTPPDDCCNPTPSMLQCCWAFKGSE